MASSQVVPEYGVGLPWSSGTRENRWFGVILGLTLVLFSVPALLIPLFDLPEQARSEAEKIPPQLAKLVQRPAPVKAEPEPVAEEPEEAPEPVKKTQESKKPKLVKPKTERPKAPPEQTVEAAREKASRSGLLAMKSQLAALREPEPTQTQRFVANVDAGAADVSKGAASSQVANVLQGSGGVSEVAVPDSNVDVASHEVKTVSAPVSASGQVAAAATPAAVGGSAQEGTAERAMSNIRSVFDAQKTALYSLYRRELRQDPTLEGKVMLELVIEPDGTVSACRVVSSELSNPTLEQRIAMRVRLFDFGAENVETRKVRFPIDFLPG